MTTVDLASVRTAAPTPGPKAARARDAVIAALRPSDHALAAWEAGSAAFGRADEASDFDVAVLCMPGTGEQVLDELEVEVGMGTAATDPKPKRRLRASSKGQMRP